MLYNWRCFRQRSFVLPENSFALIDTNGSGKSSLMYALHSIYTGKSWPGTKLIKNMTQGQNYFGLLTDEPNWSFSGQIKLTGRLSTRFNKPPDIEDVWPVLFTYSPDDNYWLKQPRNIKLQTLDQLLCKINPEYVQLITNLDKYVRSKQRMLKYQEFADMRMVIVITRSIHELSQKIWQIRHGFLDYINQNMSGFGEWIDSDLVSWQVSHEVSDQEGVRRLFQEEGNSGHEINDTTIETLWQKEKMIGKVMFGAQRDDFYFKSGDIRAKESLSRGENRLLTLYIKFLTQQKVLEMQNGRPIWWLLDDVYNELDSMREDILHTKILDAANYYIYSGTKSPNTPITSFSIDDLGV